MSTNRHIGIVCCCGMAAAILIMALFFLGAGTGSIQKNYVYEYENKLFNTEKVHTIDIAMDDWDSFIEQAKSKEYEACSLTIDGEEYKNAAIRGKGNTSLTSVEKYGNDRYSFKVEFDHYSSGSTYYGLDKLSLNNLISDNTYMKDYLCYTMMRDMGVAAPLCSYVNITVNGEPWGLYLAVEGVEEAFLQRNYGADYGELYKPDSQSVSAAEKKDAGSDEKAESEEKRDLGSKAQGGAPPQMDNGSVSDSQQPEDMKEQAEPPDRSELPQTPEGTEPPEPPEDGSMPENMPKAEDGAVKQSEAESPKQKERPENGMQNREQREGADAYSAAPKGKDGGHRGQGSEDVKLQYIDDDPESYPNIFGNAKTDITTADKKRLIASLKALSDSKTAKSVLNTQETAAYFAVHNFVCNGDSYTGSIVHNYYLYEEKGSLSMIPWDYNLAFGGFSAGGGGGEDRAAAEINAPIDSPVSGGDISDRPMVAWIFENESYTKLYHSQYSKFIKTYFESGYFDELVDEVTTLISPYVKKEQAPFCTYEEYEKGVKALRSFCKLRAESVSGQLSGDIPSTEAGQSEDKDSLVDAAELKLGDMGAFFGGGRG